MPYGVVWREHRRAFWQHFNPGAIVKYRLTQRAYAQTFLRKLLMDPTHRDKHIE